MLNILEVRFKDSVDMCGVVRRFAHFYEMPGFMGAISSHKELDDHYLSKYGRSDWWQHRFAGSNLPDHVFDSFRDRDDLNEDERWLMSQVEGLDKPFYVILTAANIADDVRDHELAHAFYYLSNEYKSLVDGAMNRYASDIGHILSFLRSMYDEKVVMDECQAYVGPYTRALLTRFITYPQALHFEIMSHFRTFKEHNPVIKTVDGSCRSGR